MAFSLAEIREVIGGQLVNAAEMAETAHSIRVSRPAPLAEATSSDVAFFFSKEYQSELPGLKAGILVTGTAFVAPLIAAKLPFFKTTAVLACDDPYLALATLSELLATQCSAVGKQPQTSWQGIHPSAVVHESAQIAETAVIGPHCVIEAGASIGAHTVLYAGCFVGPRARIGENSFLFSGVTLYEFVQVGDRVRIHSGAVLGADGFGYAPIRENKSVIGHRKIYHLGRVRVGNDVEIGANSTIDRGTMGDTVIGNMAKLDNLVHVGHNAQVAEGAIICGGTCLAGRAKIGKFAYLGGLTGVSNAVEIGDGAQVGALSLITKDMPAGTTAVGNPQREYREHFKAHAALNRLVADRKKKD